MRSISCASCGLVGWADAGNCKRCGQPFPVNRQPPPRVAPPPDYDTGYNAGYNHNNYGPGDFGAPAKKRKGYAVASLVIGIIGFFTFGILLIGTAVGTTLGIVALKKEGGQPAVYGGKGLAIAGIVMNLLAVCMIVPLGIVTAIAIPNLLASRRAANEASAIRYVRVITMAEGVYYATKGAGYGTMSQLAAGGMIDSSLAAGEMNGYVFTVTASGGDFEVRATPRTPSHGTRSFYTSAADGGEIHVGLKGQPASASDPTLDSLYGPQYGQQPRRVVSQPGWQSAAPAY
ncbi:MAG TPA: DUF4190 domain-containing protein [Pyrinomonadaceae bacterium]|jgi:type II secretory pathway pseudopilin PulG|nr:DUF4190 domain-containing protein [Pyrinomonadaceae bacterium]